MTIYGNLLEYEIDINERLRDLQQESVTQAELRDIVISCHRLNVRPENCVKQIIIERGPENKIIYTR
jgi:hypothetical protein